jgi:PAS domain S-box-containing protein
MRWSQALRGRTRLLLPLAVGATFVLAWLYPHEPLLYAAAAAAIVAALAVALVRSRRARARAEEQLRASEERFRGTLDRMIEGCQIIGPDWRYLYVNEAAAAHGHRRRDELLGRTMMECYPGIEHTELFATLRRCMESRTSDALENEFAYPDGTTGWFLLSIQPASEGIFILSLDVSERRRAAASVGDARNRLQHVLASSPAVLYTLRVDGEAFVCTWVSDNISRLLGFSESEALAPHWWADRVHPDDVGAVLAGGRALLEQGHLLRDYRFRHERGEYLWIRDEQRLLRDESGRPMEVVGSWSDITARKEAEQRLFEGEEQYRLLFDSNPHPMWVYDRESLGFLAVNEAARQRYGWTREEFLRMTIKDIRPLAEVSRLMEHIRRQRGGRRELGSSGTWTHLRKDGTPMEVEVASSPIVLRGRPASLTLVTDVTERRLLETRMQQLDKMEAVGQLAGGIAHDFNNLLGVILGFSDLLAKDLGPDHRGERRLLEIRKAAERAATLTRQLLAFSRRQVLQPTVIDVNEALRDTERMLRRLIGEDIEFRTRYADDLARVKVDRNQLDQVIVNLAVNARDAMPAGGTLVIETANAELDQIYARTRPEVRPGAYVMLAISDTGHGMSVDTQARVFEPFFTTKEPGKGTGLGLATVHGIVRQSGGHVAVYSEAGRGTTFKVYLPRVDEPLTPRPEAIEAPPVHGHETVLLVEDAEGLRTAVAEMLAADGYTVLSAADPAEALEEARTHDGIIHCLLTDVVMPYMSGRELAQRLRLDHPAIKVVFMSGYADEAILRHGLVEAGIPFLQKPFTAQGLLRKLSEVLAQAPAAPRGHHAGAEG